jgi:hypothetical protein
LIIAPPFAFSSRIGEHCPCPDDKIIKEGARENIITKKKLKMLATVTKLAEFFGVGPEVFISLD